MKRLKITAEIQRDVCSFIQAGGFPHVAAEAAGVPKEVFEEWMKRGESSSKKAFQKPFIAFRIAVQQAQAQARLTAEIAAHKDNPLVWLKQGPGKETAESRGWTQTVKPVPTTNNQINVLLSPEMQGVFAALLQILSPYPEARAAVSKALSGDMQPKMIEA